jgi:thiamine biosynthesis lipoprotein
MQVVALRDMAMATSGDYRNFFSVDGRRYSHTIDPRTGRTVRHRLASVTLFADNCTDADAWATALLALGEQLGPPLADKLDLKALFVVRTDQGFSTQASAALRGAAWWPGQAR